MVFAELKEKYSEGMTMSNKPVQRLFFTVLIFLCGYGLSAQYLLSIDSLKQKLLSSQSDTLKARLFFEIGREEWFRRNFQEARHYLNKSVQSGKAGGYPYYLADAYNLLANVYMKQEIYDSALSCLQKGLDIKDSKFNPSLYETYSKLYYQLGDYQTSLQYALQSAEGFEKSVDPLFNMQSVFSYLMVGDILYKLGREQSAFEYYQKAYKKGRTADKNWYIKTPIQKIAHCYYLKNEFDKATHLFDTIIAIDKDAPSFEPTMHSYEGLGNIAMKQERFARAIDYYRLSLQYALKQGLSVNVENFYTKLGSAFMADQQEDSALYYLNLVVSRSSRGKDLSNLSAAYHALATIRKKQGKYAEALQSFELHTNYYDSILNIEKIRSLNNLEVLYRTRQNENEILRLRAVEQEKDFAIRKRNISIWIGIGLVIVMVVILLLLKRTYSHKQKLQEERVKQMERLHQVASLQSMINGQETERSRVARDLHDGLGGLFSTVKMYFSTLEHDHSELKANELFRKSFSLVDTASVEIRRIAHNMMPEVLMKMGLVNAVKDLSDNISSGRTLKVSMEVHGMHERLNSSTEIMLYRIVQELLNNIIKHARATAAIIQFIRDGNRLSVSVEDNGCGFNALEADGKIHTGIETVRSRVNYLDGKLTIDSQRNIGTTVMMDFLISESLIEADRIQALELQG